MARNPMQNPIPSKVEMNTHAQSVLDASVSSVLEGTRISAYLFQFSFISMNRSSAVED